MPILAHLAAGCSAGAAILDDSKWKPSAPSNTAPLAENAAVPAAVVDVIPWTHPGEVSEALDVAEELLHRSEECGTNGGIRDLNTNGSIEDTILICDFPAQFKGQRWFTCRITSLPPKRTTFDSRWGRFPVGSLPDFRIWGSWWTMSRWSAAFLEDLPFPPPFHSGAAPYSPRFTLISSQDLDVKEPPKSLHSPPLLRIRLFRERIKILQCMLACAHTVCIILVRQLRPCSIGSHSGWYTSSCPRPYRVLYRSEYDSRYRYVLFLSLSRGTKANRVQSPAESPDFCKWESCRAMPFVSGFSRRSPNSPAPSFQSRSLFTSITLIGPQDLAMPEAYSLNTIYTIAELESSNGAGVFRRMNHDIPRGGAKAAVNLEMKGASLPRAKRRGEQKSGEWGFWKACGGVGFYGSLGGGGGNLSGAVDVPLGKKTAASEGEQYSKSFFSCKVSEARKLLSGTTRAYRDNYPDIRILGEAIAPVSPPPPHRHTRTPTSAYVPANKSLVGSNKPFSQCVRLGGRGGIMVLRTLENTCTIDSELQCQTVSPGFAIIGFSGLAPAMVANLKTYSRQKSELAQHGARYLAVKILSCLSFKKLCRIKYSFRAKHDFSWASLAHGKLPSLDAQRSTKDDNIRYHVSRATIQPYADNNVRRLDWPAQSPDLNPIEHLRNELDRRVRARQARPKSIAQLMEWLQEEWRRIPVDVLQTLVEGRPDRVAAVIAARGGPARF
ncbi:hypothetical protein PR048_029213 [Dryococelus australis]|uniref:Uncharacterized protein n=1 Tax=Dryococelus australis TaxID=614101 RepID=A0ABQ9GDE5_9NEOP|nr:hypothetical protein PR048_029213 [Dryococelus australis]